MRRKSSNTTAPVGQPVIIPVTLRQEKVAPKPAPQPTPNAPIAGSIPVLRSADGRQFIMGANGMLVELFADQQPAAPQPVPFQQVAPMVPTQPVAPTFQAFQPKAPTAPKAPQPKAAKSKSHSQQLADAWVVGQPCPFCLVKKGLREAYRGVLVDQFQRPIPSKNGRTFQHVFACQDKGETHSINRD